MSFAIIPHPIKNVNITSTSKISSSKGKVLFQDNFEGTLKWSNMSKDSTATRMRSGDSCGKIQSAGANPWTTNSRCYGITTNPEILNSKIGIEFYFQPDTITGTELSAITFKGTVYDGTTAHNVGLKYDFVNTKFQFWNSAGSWEDITGASITLTADYYYRVKIVFDLATDYYDKIEIGSDVFDLSSEALETGASAVYRFYCLLSVIGIDANQFDVYFDDFTVTYDEP